MCARRIGAAARTPSPRDIAKKEFPMRRSLASFLAAVVAAVGTLVLGPGVLLGPDDALAAGIDLTARRG
jgi:hypothetical protein